MPLPIGFSDVVGNFIKGATPGRLGETLANNIINPGVDAYGTPRLGNYSAQNPAPTAGQGQYMTDGSTPVVNASSTTSTAPSNPWASFGGGYDAYMNQKNNIYGSARDAANTAAPGFQGSILDFITQGQTTQRNINERGNQAELAKRQGRTSILDMVGRGVRSLGSMLAGRNAADSSAMMQGAKAYGDFGMRQMNDIGNQYAQENRQIGFAQDDLANQLASGQRRFGEDKNRMISGIVSNARNELAKLDAALAEADAPTRIAIEQEKAAIEAEVRGILSQFDPTLQQGVAGITPTSLEQRQAQAAQMAQAGQGATNPFEFTNQVPAAFQGTSQFAGGLPLFTLPRRRET